MIDLGWVSLYLLLMATNQVPAPRLNNEMILAYAARGPVQKRLADRALRGCRSSRHEVAYEIGADAFEAVSFAVCSSPVYTRANNTSTLPGAYWARR